LKLLTPLCFSKSLEMAVLDEMPVLQEELGDASSSAVPGRAETWRLVYTGEGRID